MRTQATWVVKGSKFCNMRCSYCYEWEELANRERISLDLWARVFRAMKEYRELTEAAGKGPASAFMVLHGGEPLALPLPYLREVLDLRRNILGDDRQAYPLAMQTNAFRVTDDMIDLLREYRVRVGVSFDTVPGVRLSVAGQTTESRVEANIARLRAACDFSGGIAVLAKHTAPRVKQIHDWYAANDLSFRILPLFEGPESRPDGYELSTDQVEAALEVLFDHWISAGARLRLEPFDFYLRSVTAKMLGLKGRLFDRSIDLGQVFAVNTDGTIYHVPEALEPEKRLGDLNTQTIGEILASQAFTSSVERDRERLNKHCGECEYASSCGGSPLLQSWQLGPFSGRCPVAYNFHRFVERYITEHGFTGEDLATFLNQPSDEAPQMVAM